MVFFLIVIVFLFSKTTLQLTSQYILKSIKFIFNKKIAFNMETITLAFNILFFF